MDNLNVPKLKLPRVKEIFVNFIKKEVKKAGFENVVVGLSGGVDSALAAILAAEALGNIHTYTYIMPYKTSSKESVGDAIMLAEKFKLPFEVIDISPIADSYFEMEKEGLDNIRRGNVLARIRMLILFDKSAKMKALVLGTTNKTELLLGYGTIYGDMACSINPLGDLYKTQIWQLSKYIGIPNKIIEKIPTADLWEGQTDEKELGFLYRDIDALLYHMIDKKMDEDSLIKLGFEKKMIKAMAEKVKNSQFKRRLPVIARISYE